MPSARATRRIARLLPALLACGALAAGLWSSVPARSRPLNAGAPGRTLEKPPDTPAPGFAIDSTGRLLVVDHLRGFLIGRFKAPSGIGFETAPGEGGVPLDAPQPIGPALPPVPLTTLALQRGFPFFTASSIAASPCIADLDRDGRMELVVACSDGTVDLLKADGRPALGWPVHLERECFAPPAAGDTDDDGRLEIAIADASGRVHLFEANGKPAAGWPVEPAGSGEAAAIYAAPAMDDIDGDGNDEICVADASGSVRVLDGKGALLPGWPQATGPDASTAAGTPAATLASPALADLDGRPGLEIVTGAHSGQVCAWDRAGQPLPGWPVTLPGKPRAGFGDPAIGDVNGDGRPEIVIVADAVKGHPPSVFVLDAGAHVLPGWPVALPEACNAGAALGDLNGDGADDIVIATIGGNAALLALDGRQAAPLAGWPVHFSDKTVNAVPVIADLDGDGGLDVLVAPLSTGLETHAWLWAADHTGRELRAFPIFLPYDEIVRGGPAVADLDADGDLELVCGTEVLNSLYVWDLDALCEPDLLPWPGEAGGPARTGRIAGSDDAGTRAARRTRALAQTAEADVRPVAREPLDPGTPLESGVPLDAPPLFGEGTALDGRSPSEARSGKSAPNPAVARDAAGALSTIAFELDAERAVVLIVYDIKGKEVRRLLDHRLPPGRYAIYWDGRDDSGQPRQSGAYFYQLRLGDRSTTRQLMLLK